MRPKLAVKPIGRDARERRHDLRSGPALCAGFDQPFDRVVCRSEVRLRPPPAPITSTISPRAPDGEPGRQLAPRSPARPPRAASSARGRPRPAARGRARQAARAWRRAVPATRTRPAVSSGALQLASQLALSAWQEAGEAPAVDGKAGCHERRDRRRRPGQHLDRRRRRRCMRARGRSRGRRSPASRRRSRARRRRRSRSAPPARAARAPLVVLVIADEARSVDAVTFSSLRVWRVSSQAMTFALRRASRTRSVTSSRFPIGVGQTTRLAAHPEPSELPIFPAKEKSEFLSGADAYFASAPLATWRALPFPSESRCRGVFAAVAPTGFNLSSGRTDPFLLLRPLRVKRRFVELRSAAGLCGGCDRTLSSSIAIRAAPSMPASAPNCAGTTRTWSRPGGRARRAQLLARGVQQQIAGGHRAAADDDHLGVEDVDDVGQTDAQLAADLAEHHARRPRRPRARAS